MWLLESRHDGKMRKISFILSLNESEENFVGGKHDLMQISILNLRLVRTIVFLSDCPHRIGEVTDGRKDLLVGLRTSFKWLKFLHQ